MNQKPIVPVSKGAINFPDPIKQAFSWPYTGRNLSSEIRLRLFTGWNFHSDSVKYFQGNGANLLNKKMTNIFSLSKKTNQNYDWTFFRCAESNSSLSHFSFLNGVSPVHFVDCRLPEPPFLGLITPFNIFVALSSITNINMELINFL